VLSRTLSKSHSTGVPASCIASFTSFQFVPYFLTKSSKALSISGVQTCQPFRIFWVQHSDLNYVRVAGLFCRPGQWGRSDECAMPGHAPPPSVCHLCIKAVMKACRSRPGPAKACRVRGHTRACVRVSGSGWVQQRAACSPCWDALLCQAWGSYAHWSRALNEDAPAILVKCCWTHQCIANVTFALRCTWLAEARMAAPEHSLWMHESAAEDIHTYKC